MAKGNIFYTIPKSEENNQVSTKIGERYKWIDENEKTVILTWLQLQERLSNKFGKPTYKKFNGEEYLVLEFNASFLKGEVEELINNGAQKQEPNFTVWEADEIRNFGWDEIKQS